MDCTMWHTSLQRVIVSLVAVLVLASAKQKVLVIGGTQFIGRHTVELLRAQPDVHVEILHTGRSPSPWSSAEVPETLCDRQTRCLADKVRESWWMVVDFPVYSVADAQAIIDNARFIKHYVFISTDDIYMVCDRSSFKYENGRLLEDVMRPPKESEQQRLNTADDYGHQKKEIEEKLASEIPDQYTSLRLPDVWGPFENTGRFFEFIEDLAKGHSIGLTVSPIVGSGETFSPAFVFAKDVAKIVTLLAHAEPQGVMNLAISEAPTLRELVEFTHALLPNPPPLQLQPSVEAPLVSVDVGPLSIERAQKLGFEPTPWQEGWRQAVEVELDSLPPPAEANDHMPLPLPTRVDLGRVLLRREEFRRAFTRFQGDVINGLTYGKLRRMGEECIVTFSYDDKTIKCLFDDGEELDFPWEAVAKQLTKGEDL